MAKVEITDLLNALDSRNFTWYNGLSEEDKKDINMWLVMRWASSVEKASAPIPHHYLTMVNNLVNVHFNILRDHPEMQWRLMQTCAIGAAVNHKWIKPGKGKAKVKGNAKMVEFYLKLYPHLSDDEVEWVLSQMTKRDKIDLLTRYGVDDSKIKVYLK